jgi:hypothetical protein
MIVARVSPKTIHKSIHTLPLLAVSLIAAAMAGAEPVDGKPASDKPAGAAVEQAGNGNGNDGNGQTEDEGAQEDAESSAAVAIPVNPEPVRVYGWREYINLEGVEEKLLAKLDTGALTSSIHAEEKELFERDGKKWVRFVFSDPRDKKPVRTRMEAPLVRIARIKEPNDKSEVREVVRLSYHLGERKLGGEFTLNNRSNMLAPVLIGRNCLKNIGWVDPARTHLADQNILR